MSSIPSAVTRWPASAINRSFTSDGSDDAPMLKRSSTAVETLLTFCPPGPGRADEPLLDVAVVEDDGVGDGDHRSSHYRILTMHLRAVVFDFDGVIANSEPLHFRALHDVLASTGVSLSERDYYARYLGFDDVAAFQAIGADSGAFGPEQVASLVSRKAVRFEELEADARCCFPAPPTPSAASPRRCRLRIASGARRDEILRVLEAAGLTDLFAAIVAAEDASPSKPDPAPYLLAVRLLGAVAGGGALRPAECVAIEDSHWGIESARQAGLRTIAVTHTYKAAELGAADLVLDSLEALDVASLSRRLA